MIFVVPFLSQRRSGSVRNVFLDLSAHRRRFRDCVGNFDEVFRRDEPPLPHHSDVCRRFTSFWFPSAAVEHIPIGTAYAVWTGIGAVGTALLGMLSLRRIRELAAPAKHRGRARRNRRFAPLLATITPLQAAERPF